MVVVQAEERNMYDQHWISSVLKEKYPFLYLLLIYIYDFTMYTANAKGLRGLTPAF